MHENKLECSDKYEFVDEHYKVKVKAFIEGDHTTPSNGMDQINLDIGM